MKRLVPMLLALTFALPAAAELYRWTDDQGRVHYSDMPPPASVKKMQRIRTPGSASGEATQNRPPVVLFNANCGATCDQATDYLRQRGVPFSLKAADKDKVVADELKARTGALEVPVLFVGESMQRGYSPSVWDKMLEVAGYPAPGKKPAETNDDAAAPPPPNY